MDVQAMMLGVLIIAVAAVDWYFGGWQAFWKARALSRFDRTKRIAAVYDNTRRPKSLRLGPVTLAVAGLAMIGYGLTR